LPVIIVLCGQLVSVEIEGRNILNKQDDTKERNRNLAETLWRTVHCRALQLKAQQISWNARMRVI